MPSSLPGDDAVADEEGDRVHVGLRARLSLISIPSSLIVPFGRETMIVIRPVPSRLPFGHSFSVRLVPAASLGDRAPVEAEPGAVITSAVGMRPAIGATVPSTAHLTGVALPPASPASRC